MKHEDKDYEKWLSAVKRRQPVLENPNELTDLILRRVSRIRSAKKQRKILVGTWMSGVAATLLLCLFINETVIAPSSYQVKEEKQCEYWQNNSYSSLPENWEEMKAMEKGAFLSSYYAQLRQIKQERISDILKKNR